MKKTPEQKNKLNNFIDLLCDEIYGKSINCGGDILVAKKDIRKIAKKVAKRWMIGPR